MLTIALAKGRLADSAAHLFKACGINTSEILSDTRKLIFSLPDSQMRFLLVKPSDVPVYVYRGSADMGVAGKDSLLEAGLPLYEMLDLGFGRCRICEACCDGSDEPDMGRPLIVATKYPRIASMYYSGQNREIEIIKLHGSIELAPLVGLSDVIVDVVESGTTLRENGLHVTKEILDVSARLVVNRVSLKAKATEIGPFIQNIREVARGTTC